MKKLFALSVVLFSLIGGSVSAFAGGQDGLGVSTVDAPENAFGINYPELPCVMDLILFSENSLVYSRFVSPMQKCLILSD